MCLVGLAAVLIALLWLGAYVKGGAPITPQRLVLITLNLVAFGMLTMMMWLMSAGYPRWSLEVPKLLHDLGISEEDLRLHAPEDLRDLANTSLARLAYVVSKVEQKHPPYSEERRLAKYAFQDAYRRCLMFGFIVDVGYGHFFKKSKEVSPA